MPLNEASCAVVVICDRMPLNWLTRLLRTVCADASTTGAVAVVNVSALVSVPPIAPPESDRAEGRRSIVVGGGDRQLAGGVDRRGQVVGQQRGIELVERLDRAVGAVAEGDVDRRAAVEGGEGQGLAGQAAGAAVRAAVKLVAVPVLPVRPSADSALPVPVMLRSAAVPVLIFSVPLARSTRLSRRWRSANVAAPLALVAVRRRWRGRSREQVATCRPAERRSSCRCRR